MDIFSILKAFIGAITAVILSATGHGIVATSTPQTAIEMASTTDAIVYQVAQTATTTEPSAIQQAYELGKSVGELKARVEMLDKVIATTTPATPQIVPQPTQIINQPTQNIMTPATAPISQARIEIISPIPTKGLGRQHVASPTIEGEDNYVVLGAIVYDANGNVDKNAVVTISATDASQNKVENGAGDMVTIYTDGVKNQVLGYVYSYEFRTQGDHTITFSVNGLTKDVVINAK